MGSKLHIMRRIATEQQVPIPGSIVPKSLEDAIEFANYVDYPIVMKPRSMSTYGNFRLPLQFKVAYAKDPQDLKSKLQPFVNAGVFPIIQEYLQGVKVNQGVLRCGGGKS